MTATVDHACLMADVCGVVRQSAKVPAKIEIRADSRLVEDLAIDSLDLIQLILQLQDRFGIVIDEDAVPKLCRVGDLAAYLSERRESRRN